jgi:hypothetical protein
MKSVGSAFGAGAATMPLTVSNPKQIAKKERITVEPPGEAGPYDSMT